MVMLRKISIALNSVVLLLSLAIFVYTFFAKYHLIEHTRGFLTERTLSYSAPLVEAIEAGLDSRLAQKLISEERREGVEAELESYSADPVEYVTSLTSADSVPFGVGKIAKFKEKVRDYYQSTLGALLRDLRIFSGSNVIASLFAIFLLFSQRYKGEGSVVTFSFVVFAAVAFSAYSYLKGVSFLTILFKWHLGWWYPVVILFTILWLVFEFGLHKGSDRDVGTKG